MSLPNMIFVDSSNVEAIGYDSGQRDLYVQFQGGRTYIYANVSEQTYNEFLRADSKGSYLNREIKPNYEYRED